MIPVVHGAPFQIELVANPDRWRDGNRAIFMLDDLVETEIRQVTVRRLREPMPGLRILRIFPGLEHARGAAVGGGPTPDPQPFYLLGHGLAQQATAA